MGKELKQRMFEGKMRIYLVFKLKKMKKKLILSLITILFFKSYSQLKFESGYFITNAGVKVNCLIKNFDWKDNPTNFTYKLADNTNTLHNTIDSVKEFGINNEFVFRKFTVGIDRASEDIDNMSTNKEPELNNETLFLKVLVQGKASLYYYGDGNLVRYFYTIDTSNAVQLIYKSYRVGDEGIKQNKTYQEQLWQHLKCEKISTQDVENADYNTN